jgi:hypothetical protein
MKEIELKKCPFCGGEVRIDAIDAMDMSCFMVGCRNKDCICHVTGAAYDTLLDAVEAWNRRADDD